MAEAGQSSKPRSQQQNRGAEGQKTEKTVSRHAEIRSAMMHMATLPLLLKGLCVVHTRTQTASVSRQ